MRCWVAVLVVAVGCDARPLTVTIDRVAVDACMTASACFGWEVVGCTETAAKVLADPDFFRRARVGAGPPPGVPAPTIDFSARIYRCLAAARNDCGAAQACIGPLASCDLVSTPGTCNDSIAVNCGSQFGTSTLTYLDCGDAGLGCAVTNDPVPQAACGMPCASDGDWCDGDKYFACYHGLAYEVDCDIFGKTCSLAQWTGHVCIGAGASCRDSRGSCEGTILTTCAPEDVTSTGHFATYDCARVEPLSTCRSPTNLTLARCVGAPSCPSPELKCQGTRLQYCALGENIDVDCRDQGFSTCVVAANGSAVCQ